MITKNIINKYASEYYRKMYSLRPDKNENDNILNGLRFLEKYAIEDIVFKKECVPIMQNVFRTNVNEIFDLENMSINDLFQFGIRKRIIVNSPLFDKDRYYVIQRIAKAFKDDYFFIIEDETCEKYSEMAFKLKIPVSLTWEELTEGGFVADVVFNMPQNNYYVFGNNGKWGRWCDYENPWIDYEVFGYKMDLQEVQNYLHSYELTNNECDELLLNMEIPTIIKYHMGLFDQKSTPYP